MHFQLKKQLIGFENIAAIVTRQFLNAFLKNDFSLVNKTHFLVYYLPITTETLFLEI